MRTFKLISVLIATIALTGCSEIKSGSERHKEEVEQENKESKYFSFVQDNTNDIVGIYIDKETKCQYIATRGGYAGGHILTPRLDKDGKLICTQ